MFFDGCASQQIVCPWAKILMALIKTKIKFHRWIQESIALGFVRQFFSKRVDFSSFTRRQIKVIQRVMNEPLRKMLDHRTPHKT